MAKKKISEKQRILTPVFRVSYPHVFKPSAMEGGKPKYSVTMLFKKDADLSVIKAAMKHAKITEFGADSSEWPKGVSSPVNDGDSPEYAGREGYKGHWAIKATSNEEIKPGVVGLDVEPIIDQADFYPGCYARAQVMARVWEFPPRSGKYGVQFILDHVQKYAEGKPFSSKKAASEVFSPITSGEMDGEEENEEDADDGFL